MCAVHRLNRFKVFRNVSLPKVSLKANGFLLKPRSTAYSLNSDRDNAGEKYEFIRLKLLKYFHWCGSELPDIDADETINRVARRIDEGQDVYNLTGYISGVAKLVHAESLKRRNRRCTLDEESMVELPSNTAEDERNYQECLERCLGRLNDEDREVITEYYRYKKTENRLP